MGDGSALGWASEGSVVALQRRSLVAVSLRRPRSFSKSPLAGASRATSILRRDRPPRCNAAGGRGIHPRKRQSRGNHNHKHESTDQTARGGHRARMATVLLQRIAEQSSAVRREYAVR